ncbi:hypothetical protein I310_06528 [Cryptococcus deuterogattii CA1014]|nr:hypothetical protein I310_06528 [Cryptococcus deuterogattii CA1014]
MSLPKDFIWGFGTASYQIEGAIKQDGRGPSIWDTHCDKPGAIADGSSGEIACDSYNRTAEDIALLKSYGAKAYRFSISWSRVIPLGGRNDPINDQGLNHYVQFVDDLLAAGIQPLVTLYQWDLPEALHQRYRGPLNKDEFVADFTNYARIMFRALSPKVKIFMTFTEPWVISIFGYQNGLFAPGRSSDRTVCAEGDSTREQWIVGHNLLLAHASAAKVYREEFKPTSEGEIGLTNLGDWAYPYDKNNEKDREAANRFVEFCLGWFTDPIYLGDYPKSMREQLGDRLPKFTSEEAALVKDSNDFFGLDYYTANYIKHADTPAADTDFMGNLEKSWVNSDGQVIGPESQHVRMRPNPQGLRALLNWIHKRYNGPKIYLVENGTSVKGENDLPMIEAINDEFSSSGSNARWSQRWIICSLELAR